MCLVVLSAWFYFDPAPAYISWLDGHLGEYRVFVIFMDRIVSGWSVLHLLLFFGGEGV